jgi:SNF family Na+-dependent transporter
MLRQSHCDIVFDIVSLCLNNVLMPFKQFFIVFCYVFEAQNTLVTSFKTCQKIFNLYWKITFKVILMLN